MASNKCGVMINWRRSAESPSTFMEADRVFTQGGAFVIVSNQDHRTYIPMDIVSSLSVAKQVEVISSRDQGVDNSST